MIGGKHKETREVFRWKVVWGRPRIRATIRQAEGGEVGRTACPRNSICRGKYQGVHSKRHAVHGAVPRMCDREAGPSTAALNAKLSSHGIWWRGEGLLCNAYTQQRYPELLPGISNTCPRLSRHKFGHIISSPFFPSPESHLHLTLGTKSSLCSLEQLLRCCKWQKPGHEMSVLALIGSLWHPHPPTPTHG